MTPPTLASGTGDDGSDVDEVVSKTGDRDGKIEELHAEIYRQREVISLLTSRLNFVLSMFRIDEIPDIPSKQECVTLQSEVSVTSEASVPVKAGITPSASFQSAVLSTVYRETKQQEVRSKNFVVHGLPASPNDQTSVEQLCETELHLKPAITLCKRIGKKVAGKVQPLKITVRSAEQATSVIACARNLRKSTDEYIQGNIYINADLTKAQAAAAYQARCQRRQAQADRNNWPSQRNVLRHNADEFVPSRDQ